MPEWFENEIFWEELYPYLFTEERFEAANEEVEKILRLTSFDGDSVLDLACGPGRHSTAFASRGYQVTAVDLSEFLLSKAKSRAEELGAEVEWLREDMRGFSRKETFGLAINLYTSFGYFEDEEDNIEVLRNARRSLLEGGQLVLDMHGKESLARRFQEVRLYEYEDGAVLIDHPSIEDDWERVRAKWILIRGDTVKRFTFSVRLYSGEEIKGALKSAGFSKVHIYGDLDGNPYGIDAERLIVVGVK